MAVLSKLTTANPNTAQPLAWFDEYSARIRPADTYMTFQELFAEYLALLYRKVGYFLGMEDPPEEILVSTERLFGRWLGRFCKSRKYHQYLGGPVGYYIRLAPVPKSRTLVAKPAPQPDLKPRRSSRNHRSSPQVTQTRQQTEDPLYVIARCPGEKEMGMFAGRDLTPNTFIAEYLGERISPELAEIRERAYKRDKRQMTMVWITNTAGTFCVDGQRKDRRTYFSRFGNPATLLNNKTKNPPCKLVTIGTGRDAKFWLVTRRNVARGFELTWNYGDKRRGLPAWCYE